MPAKPFLSHVAGLRAIAILFVVWFHISIGNSQLPTWAILPNSYFGVDVFLVIMGYFLIESFVRRPDYKLVDFAQGKAVRLIPPLAVMVLCSLCVCMWDMDYKELRAMAKTGLGAMLGYSNYQLLDSSAGYFVESTALNAFLHTWYLAVTIQVFAIAYALFALLRNRPRKFVLLTLCMIGTVSLLWHQADNIRTVCVVLGGPRIGPDELASYYDTLPRLWEVLAGGVALLLPSLRSRSAASVISLAGLVLIIVPSLLPEMPLDATLPVVVGTVLVIRYMGDSQVHILLGNRVLIWLGGISFSVYLVHMPVLVMYRAVTLSSPDLMASFAVLVVAFILGYVFWRYVEKRRFSIRLALTCWITATVFCAFVDITRGMQKIWNAEANSLDIPRYTEWEPCYREAVLANLNTDCHKDEGGWHTLAMGSGRSLDVPFLWLGKREVDPCYVLIGDSHAQAYFSGFDICSKETGITGVYFSSIMIPFWNREVLPVTKQYFYNREKGESFMAWLRAQESIHTVVVAQYWTRISMLDIDWDKQALEPGLEQGAAALREFCLKVKACGKQLVLLGPLPYFSDSKVLNYGRWLIRHGKALDATHPDYICTRDTFEQDFQDEIQLLQSLEREGLCKVLYPAPHMFSDGKCKAIDNGYILYKDGNHLSGVGSARVLRPIWGEFQALLQSQP